MMRLLMSDMPLPNCRPQHDEYWYVNLSELKISNCIGCFGCFVKTPGRCVIRDDAPSVYPLIAHSEQLIYVSRVCYGSYDTVMKTMLERTIPIQKAFIRLYKGETHHEQRAVMEKDAVIVAYGADSRREQELFQELVTRNAANMCFKSHKVKFVSQQDVEEAVLKEVGKWTR